MASFIKNVQIVCKTTLKSPCISTAKLCAKNLFTHPDVQNPDFSTTCSIFFTHFPTTPPPLVSPLLFHYSTDPTNTTTINNIIERN